MKKPLIVLSLLLIAFGLVACGGGGGEGGGQADQVAAGAEVFEAECVECHTAGGIGPELNAATLSAYGNAQALYDYTSANMPLDAPGSLSEQQYWDVTAHVLQEAGQLPADVVLGPDTASGVTISQ
ncbi:MAG TPA: cytochrome c [Anaerolineaceae bacterium]|nr:cytochrome c [Anaerolineaceae bacterium]